MMKRYLTVVVLLLLVIGCGKKEEDKLTLFSPEAFAFDLGDGWEVNASIRVKGFQQNEENNTYFVKLKYSIDVVTPEGKKLKEILTGVVDDKKNNERINDVAIETQFELDSTYSAGKYKILFSVTDQFKNQSVSAEKEFELGGE